MKKSILTNRQFTNIKLQISERHNREYDGTMEEQAEKKKADFEYNVAIIRGLFYADLITKGQYNLLYKILGCK